MSETHLPSNIFNNLISKPDAHEVFAVVVDGETALVMPILKTSEMYLAVWSSNPTIIKVNDDQKTDIRPGWLYDGTNFISPSEQV